MRITTRVTGMLLAATVWTLGTGITAWGAEVTVQRLAARTVGDWTYFVLHIARPADMAPLTVEGDQWDARMDAPHRHVFVTAPPAARARVYLETAELDHMLWSEGTINPMVFVGRCAATERLDAKIAYVTADRAMRVTALPLDLAGAEPLPDTPTPARRWGAAQARFFDIMAYLTHDVGGMFTYAAEHTRRTAGTTTTESRPAQREGQRGNAAERTYEVFTGALAIQESLQLDRMTEAERDRAARTVPLDQVERLTIPSHPFDRIRGGAEPRFSPLARLVPEENYYAHFSDVPALTRLLGLLDAWGGSLLRLAQPVGQERDIVLRTLEQLALATPELEETLQKAGVIELALTGSDPYLNLGSDVTLLMRCERAEAFSRVADALFAATRERHPDAKYDEARYRDVTIEQLVDPARRVSCHRCRLGDVWVYSNSRVAVERVIDTHQGRRPSLADAADFKYMRTAMPLTGDSQVAFVFFSDPFIRELVGPATRIKQKRRLEAITSLKMIANAALFDSYQHGPRQRTLAQLLTDGALHPDDLYDSEGGDFAWDPHSGRAANAFWGDLRFAKPLIEVPIDAVTEAERSAYGDFRDQYETYWGTFFDPIGMQVRLGDTVRVATHILPLIDLSAYEEWNDITGGDPIQISTARFTPDTLMRVMLHLNEGRHRAEMQSMFRMFSGNNLTTDWVGEWVTFWVEDTDAFEQMLVRQYDALEEGTSPREEDAVIDMFNATFVGGVHVTNKLSLAAFLVAFRAFATQSAPNTVIWNDLPPHHGVTIVQIAPDPRGPMQEFMRSRDEDPTDGEDDQERGPALYYATIGDAFYVSTQADALRRLIDQQVQDADPQTPSPPADISANALLFLAPRAAERARPAVKLILEAVSHRVARANLGQLWYLAECGLLDGQSIDDVTRTYLGYRMACPDGGGYRYDPQLRTVRSMIHGTPWHMQRLRHLPETSPLHALLDDIQTVKGALRFANDGLETEVLIERK